MYVDITLNGKIATALVDTGATNSFITPEEAERCNLTVTEGVGRIKAVNSATAAICGVSKGVKSRIGHWEGKINFTVALMDDFDVVLGMNFMVAAKAVPVPSAKCVMFQGGQPRVVGADLLLRRARQVRKDAGMNIVLHKPRGDTIDEDVNKIGGGGCCGHHLDRATTE
ncbi:hypothetical protein HRI_004133900 [Hibiscus trionum]|uniref:Peptidase A2 domain-containing protein n=1 Tax=Hibiscus trionum TaxID=183268 RepID=A0A9W7ML82_HIBTR|nr:hypothetical protein HRI_004133900 [Hibiscus trionum]